MEVKWSIVIFIPKSKYSKRNSYNTFTMTLITQDDCLSQLGKPETSLSFKKHIHGLLSSWNFSIPKVGLTCPKPCRRSLLSEKLTMKAFCSPSCSLVHERKLPAVANQNSRKNRQKGLTDKKSLYIFLQKSDVTEHDYCQVFVDVRSPGGGGGYGYT